jgi:hypothetical protein
MDTQMTQAFAERLGVDPAQLAAMTRADPYALLASQTGDPLMAAMIGTLMQQRATKEDRLDDQQDERDEELRERERELRRANRVIRALRQQLEAADRLTQYVATTFGACPACWGLNRLCAQCGGKGAAGYNDPALDELLAWVEPALSKAGMKVVPQD